MSTPTVVERLVAFVRRQQSEGVPADVVHEAKRLLINQLKASVGACDTPAVRILRDAALEAGAPRAGGTTILWFGDTVVAEHAATVNAALFEVLDFNETYIPTFQHAVSGVLPAVMAEAETGGQSGVDVLAALAVGIEIELACAAMLMPTAYHRGFVPGGITGAIGGATACAILLGLDDERMADAIGLAMNSGLGQYQSAGSMALPYIMGLTARNGLSAARLAAKGLTSPRLSFEGDKAMLSSYSDEPVDKIDGVLSTLGQTWRIHGQSYKTVPTETITHGPLECVAEIRRRANGRELARLRFGVEAIVINIAEERASRWGVPSNPLEARFDLKHCAAAAWVRGRFTLAEMERGAYEDPAIQDLRLRIELLHDPRHPTFDGCSVRAEFTDGSVEEYNLPAFRGTPGNPMSDPELSDVFRLSAGELMSDAHKDEILDAAWSLDQAESIRPLTARLRCNLELRRAA